MFFMGEMRDGAASIFEHPEAYFMLSVFAEFGHNLLLSRKGNSIRAATA